MEYTPKHIVEIKYDPDTYYHIAGTARLTPHDARSLENLTDEDAAKLADKQVGPTFKFTRSENWCFDTDDLAKVVKVHAPEGINAWHDKCEDGVLTIKFYKK
jgi:hypothetical protein